jgi:type I restriction enzyme S subunit
MRPAAYPRYKPSGVEWLGDVPEHWKVKRLKYLASINDEALSETTSPDFEIAYVDISSVDPVEGIVSVEEMVFEEAPSRARRMVRHGDTIVSTVRTYLRAIAPIRAPRSNLIVSTGFAVVRPRAIDPGFMSYAAREGGFVDTIVARSVGVSYPAVNASEIGTIPVPLPPADEQHAIADFLDRETAKIDTLVAKKRTLIERLKEKRTALISCTVTRGLPSEAARAAGLDPHQRLKPSGIDWLGVVPEHWAVVRLGRRIVLQRGVDITKDEQNDGSVPVVSSGGVSSFHDRSLVTGPGVVIGRKGTAGAVYYLDADFWPHDTTLWVKEFRGSNPRYVYYKLCAMDLGSFDTGSANPTVNRNLVHPVFVSWPPVDEQLYIADFLDRETAKMDQMVAKIETAIERLQEYRTALITAAVTGKIDVRGAIT